MEKDIRKSEKTIECSDWVQKPWWIQSKQGIIQEFLKILVGIKRNVPNISARIHELSTILALEYLSVLVFREGKIIKEDVNPTPRKGPDIEVRGMTKEGESCTYRAEVMTNFSFKQGPEIDKLYEDVKKLINSKAKRKFLVLLLEDLVEEVKKRCKNRRKNSIDLAQFSIEILSIEKIIGCKLL